MEKYGKYLKWGVVILGISFWVVLFFGWLAFELEDYKYEKIEKEYNFDYIHGRKEDLSVSIDGYTKLTNLNVSIYEYESFPKIEETLRNIPMSETKENAPTIDLYDVIMGYMEISDEFYNNFSDICVVELDENRTLVITYLNAAMDIEKDALRSLALEGFLLEK